LKKLEKTIFFVIFLTIVSSVGLFSFVSAQEESSILTWIKTAVGFWVNGQITDKEFLKTIEYFVENEMIKVPSLTINDEILINNLQILQAEINTKIDQSRELVNLPQIQQSLAESNALFATISSSDEIIR